MPTAAVLSVEKPDAIRAALDSLCAREAQVKARKAIFERYGFRSALFIAGLFARPLLVPHAAEGDGAPADDGTAAAGEGSGGGWQTFSLEAHAQSAAAGDRVAAIGWALERAAATRPDDSTIAPLVAARARGLSQDDVVVEEDVVVPTTRRKSDSADAALMTAEAREADAQARGRGLSSGGATNAIRSRRNRPRALASRPASDAGAAARARQSDSGVGFESRPQLAVCLRTPVVQETGEASSRGFSSNGPFFDEQGGGLL